MREVGKMVSVRLSYFCIQYSTYIYSS